MILITTSIVFTDNLKLKIHLNPEIMFREIQLNRQLVCLSIVYCTKVELWKTVSLTFPFVTDACLHWLAFRGSEIVHPAFYGCR